MFKEGEPPIASLNLLSCSSMSLTLIIGLEFDGSILSSRRRAADYDIYTEALLEKDESSYARSSMMSVTTANRFKLRLKYT